jgi:micrococcal nuclease
MIVRVRRVVLLLLVCLTCSVYAHAQKKLTASEAKQHFGENATVCGEVVSTRYAESSKGQPTFLNLDKAYPNQIFTVVIWGENRSKFGKPEGEYNGKRICVSGKITAYGGQPEIVAADPKQITVESKK